MNLREYLDRQIRFDYIHYHIYGSVIIGAISDRKSVVKSHLWRRLGFIF